MDFVGIDKLSLLDFDEKLSCVLFTKSCNFRCPFCHNGLTVLEAQTYIPFDEILSFLESRKGKLDAVVITGGEPTLMDDIVDKIKTIKSMGFLIKLDTNGTRPDVLKQLFELNLLDYVAMDIKNSIEKYPLTCGIKAIDQTKIRDSIQLIENSGVDYEFRTTLVNEFHSLKSIKEMGELIKGAKKLYLQQFVDREGVIQKGLHPVDESLANTYKEILSEYVDNVYLRGY